MNQKIQVIIVSRSNAVRLARCILWAAGFPNVHIATFVKGGFQDVEDGNLAEQFDFCGT